MLKSCRGALVCSARTQLGRHVSRRCMTTAQAADLINGHPRPPEPFKVERYFAKHEFSAPYLLCCSDCEPLSLASVLKDADADSKSRWENLSLGYTEAPGDPVLRQEISSTYNNTPADNILVLAPEEGIYLTLKALLKPGDHVVVTYPGYQSLCEVAHSIGCRLSYWQVQPRSEWDLSWGFFVEELKTLIESDTKAVIVNFPHNPTGATLSIEQWQQLCSMCSKQGIYLFSDEMYRGLEHRGAASLPTAADSYERGISLCGMSKALSMPGLRIGWVAMQDTQLLNKVMQLKDYTTICNSAPSEVLALMGLRNRQNILKANKQLLQDNLTLLAEFFQRYDDLFVWFEPHGGSITFPWLVSGENADHFCQQCLQQTGVLLLPGSQMIHESHEGWEACIRFGFGRRNMSECLSRLEPFMSTYKRQATGQPSFKQ